jgi:hypothetical protein
MALARNLFRCCLIGAIPLANGAGEQIQASASCVFSPTSLNFAASGEPPSTPKFYGEHT